MVQGKFNPNRATHEGFDSTPGAPYRRWLIQDGIKFDAGTKLPLPEEFQDPPKPAPAPIPENQAVETSVPFPPEPDAAPQPDVARGSDDRGDAVPEAELPEMIRLRQEEREETSEEGKKDFSASLFRGLGGADHNHEPDPGVTWSATTPAKKLADAHQVDLAQLTGSGRDGKITVDDVNAYLQKRNPEKE